MKRAWKVGLIITLVAIMASAVMLTTSKKASAGSVPTRAVLRLENKDPSTWNVINDSTFGTLIYETAGPKFEYHFFGRGLEPETDYSLIYYADKPDRFVNWGGNYPGALIASGTTDRKGKVFMRGSEELNMDLPSPPDTNYLDGAKIWLVPSSDYDATLAKMTAWNPTEYLFETELITYDDTDGEMLWMENKYPGWVPNLDDTMGTLIYSPSGPKFKYGFIGRGLQADKDYSLIYYADGWPGNNPGALIDSGTTDSSGNITLAGDIELDMDLPDPADANYPPGQDYIPNTGDEGAKIWLVPSSCYDADANSIIGWTPAADWLFEFELITYDDTDL